VLFPPGARPPADTENNGQAPPRGNGAACAGALSTPARELGRPHGGTVHPRRHGAPTAARYTPRRHGTPHGSTAHHGGGAREKPSPRGVGRRLYNDTPLKPAVLRRHVRPLRRAHKARRVGMNKSLLFCAFPCAHNAGRTPRRVGMNKSLLFCAFPCAHYAGRTTRRVGMDKSLQFCAFPCAHYAGRTKRGELERKNDGNIQRRGCPEKAGAMGARVLLCAHTPPRYKGTKKISEKKAKFGKFFREIALRLLWRNRHILRRHVRPLRRAHTVRRVGLKMLLIYTFIIRIYSQLQVQLHKLLDVT